MFKFVLLPVVLGVAAISLSACEGVKKSSVIKQNVGGVTYDYDLTPHDKTDN